MASQPLLEATERYSLVDIIGSLSTHHENYQDLNIWLRENVGMPEGSRSNATISIFILEELILCYRYHPIQPRTLVGWQKNPVWGRLGKAG